MTIDEAVKNVIFTENLIYRPDFGTRRIIVEPFSYYPQLCVIEKKDLSEFLKESYSNRTFSTSHHYWAPSPDDLTSDDWLIEVGGSYTNDIDIC